MKNKNKRLLVVSFLMILFFLGWLIFKQKFNSQSLLNLPDHSIIEFQVGEKLLTVELVNTPESITQGLSGREGLEVDGMLFVFTQPQIVSFWMKDMRFPIDIVWLADGQIVGIERNAQPPLSDTKDDQLERFPAPQLVNMVLETNPFLFEDLLED
ncbi:MAG: DUF192 domain-containing protein [Candidatus Paceibacterota bacterium]